MNLAHVARLNVYTTNFDELLQNWTVLTDRIQKAGGSEDVLRHVTTP